MSIDLNKLKEAVLKNTCRPTEEEERKLTSNRVIKTSPSWNNDSELGIILFVGFAKANKASNDDICDVLCIDHEECEFKAQVYKDVLTKSLRGRDLISKRFANQVALIKNYMVL